MRTSRQPGQLLSFAMIHRQMRNGLAAFSLSSISVGCLLTGGPAAAQLLGNVPRTVTIRMTDNAYSVKMLRVTKGSTLALQFTNRGSLLHEAVVGTHAAQIAHEKEMAAMGSMLMPDTHDSVSVKVGASKTLRYRFPNAGAFEIACHVPGHYKAGMKIAVVVS